MSDKTDAGKIAAAFFTVVGVIGAGAYLGIKDFFDTMNLNAANALAMKQDAADLNTSIGVAENLDKPAADNAYKDFCDTAFKYNSDEGCKYQKTKPVDATTKQESVDIAVELANLDAGEQGGLHESPLATQGLLGMTAYKQQLQKIISNGGTYKVQAASYNK